MSRREEARQVRTQRVTISPRLREETNKLLAQIKARLLEQGSSEARMARKVRDVLEEADTNGVLHVDHRRFLRAMAGLGVDLKAAESEAIFERFGAHEGEAMRFQDFIDAIGLRGY